MGFVSSLSPNKVIECSVLIDAEATERRRGDEVCGGRKRESQISGFPASFPLNSWRIFLSKFLDKYKRAFPKFIA